MDAIECLTERVSIPKLCAPGPDSEQLARIFRAAMRAPDHACLRPWRFIAISGNSRGKVGKIFLDYAVAKNPNLLESQKMRVETLLERAPLVIAVVAKLTEHPKVPDIEQLLSAGAATQNIILASFALGFGAIWRTGEYAHAREVVSQLGLSDREHVVGYIYIGTPDNMNKEVPQLDADLFVEHWD